MMIMLGILKSVFKIFLIILSAVLILIIILCLTSVSVRLSFWDEKFDWSVRYLGLKILPRKKKDSDTDTKEKEKKQKKEKNTENQKIKSEQKAQKLLMDKIWEKMQKFVSRMDMAGSAAAALLPALTALGKAVTWYAVETDILVADEDAAVCARNYGLIQTAVQNLLSQAGNYIHVKRKKIKIQYDFIQDKSSYQFRCRVKLQIGKTIGAALVFLWYYLKDRRKAGKAVIRQKL
ncbi:MAG: hypothetical protein IJ642_07055 [Oscillospiraceae bacterium]|nr:hypothetical protein [Oscillospiraceae bacterium]